MTQQNAALVEESAAAAESLKDQAARLAQAVSAFKLGQAQAEAHGTAQSVIARAKVSASSIKPQSSYPARQQAGASSRRAWAERPLQPALHRSNRLPLPLPATRRRTTQTGKPSDRAKRHL